jgi:probable O-glycosylation ligase (exosortase A-associated)
MRSGTLTARRPRATAEVSEVATRHLYWWLLLALFFEYARPAAFLPVLDAVKLQSLIPLSLFVMTIFAKGLRPLKEVFRDPLAKWILIYFAIIAFSVVTADLTFRAFNVAKLVFGHVLLFFMVVRIATTTGRIRGIYAVLIVAHLFLLMMNPQVVLNPAQRNYIQGGSFLGDGNDFSLSLCILLPMTIELALASRKRLSGLICWGVLLLLVLAIVASSSRGATLAMIAVGGYLWLRSPRKLLTLAAFAMVGLLFLAYAPDTYFDRMGTIQNYQDDGSAMGRIHAWKGAVRMFKDNPLLGVSAGNFPTAFGARYRPPEATSMAWLTAHSMYFLVLGELALPGIVALLVLLFGNMRANTRAQRYLRTAAGLGPAGPPQSLPEAERILYLLNASLIGFAVAGAFLSVAYYPHIFILTALMIAARSSTSIAPEGPCNTTSTPAQGYSAQLHRPSGRSRIGRRVPLRIAEPIYRGSQREERN